jgi:hypothetical protein
MVAMLTASQARTKARIDSVIHQEIRDIETKILTAVEAGLLSVEVDGDTVMTFSNNVDGIGTATVTTFGVGPITVTDGGTGYTTAPTVVIGAPTGVTATGTPVVAGAGDTIGSITLVAGGSGHATAPIVTISAPASGGVQATATANIAGGAVTSFTISNAGTGYTGLTPTVTVASPNIQATATATVDVGTGKITSIAVVTNGAGYITIPTVTITGGGATNSTKYLTAQDYYKTWQNLITDKVKLDQMAQVSKHFKDLSYSISQQVNSTSTITFKWSIEW